MFLRFTFPFLVLLLTSPFAWSQTPIAQARLQPLGTSVTISGIVTNGNELGIIRYMQDNSAGMALYDLTLPALDRGDSITVTGVLDDFNGLLELNPVTSVVIHSSGNPLPAVQFIPASMLNETVESELLQINNSVFAQGGNTFSANTTYLVTSNGTNFLIYVRTGSPLVGTLIPYGAIGLRGLGSQFTTGYQLLPRDTGDFFPNPAIAILTDITQSAINHGGFTLSWETDSVGTTEAYYGLTPALELGHLNGLSNSTNHSLALTGLTPSTFYYVKVFSVDGADTAFSDLGYYSTQSFSSGAIKVYFNSSVDTSVSWGINAIQLQEALDDTLIAYINRAQHSLDLTIYDFNNTGISSISNAINDAWNRGVKVRFISDGSLQATNTGVNDLLPVIPKIFSPTTSFHTIMHNKFVVIDADDVDGAIVWTGATNWTEPQVNHDPNNVIIFQDQALAKAYTLEFEEMWGDTGMSPNPNFARFGQFKLDNTPHHFNLNGKQVDLYFSPSDNTNNRLIDCIRSADETAYFASMVVTRQDLADALNDRVNAGVLSFGLTNSAVNSFAWPLMLPVFPGGHLLENQDTSIIMHHKYLIVDQGTPGSDPSVWTGSHNWSNNANNRNDENSVWVHDQSIANIFYQEFYARFIENGGLVLKVPAEEKASHDLLVYPNPGSGELTLHYTGDDDVLVSMYASDGRLVDHMPLQNKTLRYNTSRLASGIYIIRAQTSAGQVTLRWVKR